MLPMDGIFLRNRYTGLGQAVLSLPVKCIVLSRLIRPGRGASPRALRPRNLKQLQH